jgi:hypothetical protein
MKKILILLIISLTGCSSNYYPISTEKFSKSIPELNEEHEVELGLSLILREFGQMNDAIKVIKKFEAGTGYLTKDVNIGDVFLNTHETKTHKLYFNINDKSYGIAINKANGNESIYIVSGMGVRFISSNEIDSSYYEEIKIPIKKSEYFKQEFIYNGRIGNSIKFIYREFADELARPAFTQDLQYDLSESSIVGFRGMRIDVIEANNIKIKYKLLSNLIDK